MIFHNRHCTNIGCPSFQNLTLPFVQTEDPELDVQLAREIVMMIAIVKETLNVELTIVHL